MRATLFQYAIILTKAHRAQYCDPRTASEVFLDFTTQLYSCYPVVMQ